VGATVLNTTNRRHSKGAPCAKTPESVRFIRRHEARFKNSLQPYAMWGTPNPMLGLKYRIEEKCKKSYPQTDFDEAILQIVSGLPQIGAVVSTSFFEPFLDTGKMNTELSPMLDSSRYDSAYLFNMMSVGGESVNEWRKQLGRRKLPRSAN
jgi:hypothetical protein